VNGALLANKDCCLCLHCGDGLANQVHDFVVEIPPIDRANCLKRPPTGDTASVYFMMLVNVYYCTVILARSLDPDAML
jgi:hypothetical protein